MYIHTSSRFLQLITCFYFQVLNHTLLNPAFFVGQGKTVFLEALGNFHVRNYIKERIALRSFSKIQTLSTPNRDVYNFTDGHLYTVGIYWILSFIFKINLSNFNVHKIMVNGLNYPPLFLSSRIGGENSNSFLVSKSLFCSCYQHRSKVFRFRRFTLRNCRSMAD